MIDYEQQEIHSLQIGHSSSELEAQIKSLNENQCKVFSFVKEHYTSGNSSPLYTFITGGAGVGKSYLLQVLVAWLRLCTAKISESDPVILCAPTGIAARNIGGVTVHSAFKLPVQHGKEPAYKDLSPQGLQEIRKKFRMIHTVVIDEISMISAKTLAFISDRLCAIKDKEEPFGGVSVILFGDLYQLRPVRGSYVFACKELWHLFIPHFLTENVRQIENSTYANMLNRIRQGIIQETDITLLKQRQIDIKELNIISNLLHIYPTRKQVENHDHDQQEKLCNNYLTISASHFFSDSDISPGMQASDSYIPKDDRLAGGLPLLLRLSKKTPVMLLRNLYTEQGLVNGAMGVVEDFEINSETGHPTVVYVKFNDPSIGQLIQLQNHSNAIAIEMICQEYMYKGRFITREQFPLMPCWACTVHKVQGISLDKAVLSIGKEIFDCGQTYVALSRIRTLAGLYIEKLSPSSIRASATVKDEYIRLYNLTHSTNL